MRNILKNDTLIKGLAGFFGIMILFSAFVTINSGKRETLNAVSSPKFPIIMYHSVIDDQSRISKYVISPKSLEQDFKYLKDNGYSSITLSDLIEFQKNGTPLPEKCVLITFDDGYYNNYTYAAPLLKKYGFTAVLSAIGEFSEEYSKPDAILSNLYSHITFNLMNESADVFEYANHSYNLHGLSERKGILKIKGEDDSRYREVVINDTQKMQELMKTKTGKEPICYTYPFGAVDKESKSIVESLGFPITLGCEEGLNTVSSDPASLLNLKRFNREGGLSTSEFFKKIEQSK